MIVDVHAHVVPPAVLPELERHDLRPLPDAALADVDGRLRAMDAAGVDVQLVSTWVGLLGYGLPADRAASWSRLVNAGLAELAAAHPDRLRPLAHVPLQDPDAAADALSDAVGSLGMVGAEIGTTVDGAELDDPSLEPFWAAAEALRCLVLVHPDRALPGRRRPRHRLANTVGNAAETTVAGASLACGGVLERHPDLRICLVHGGGYLPWQAGRLDRGHAVGASPLPHAPSHYLRRLYYDTVVHSPAALRFLLDFAGPEHVVLGSDHPFAMGDPDPVGTLRSTPGLTAAEFALVSGGNAERLLTAVGSAR